MDKSKQVFLVSNELSEDLDDLFDKNVRDLGKLGCDDGLVVTCLLNAVAHIGSRILRSISEKDDRLAVLETFLEDLKSRTENL